MFADATNKSSHKAGKPLNSSSVDYKIWPIFSGPEPNRRFQNHNLPSTHGLTNLPLSFGKWGIVNSPHVYLHLQTMVDSHGMDHYFRCLLGKSACQFFDSRCRKAHLCFLRCNMFGSSQYWDRVGVEKHIKVQVCHFDEYRQYHFGTDPNSSRPCIELGGVVS